MTEWKAFAAFAVDYLGILTEAMPFYSADNKWKKKAKRIETFVLEVGNFGHDQRRDYSGMSYLKRKFVSFWVRLSDMLRQISLFPKDSRFVFLHNETNVPFITGDQPVINTLWDEKQDKIEVFYPLSPISALMVCFNPGEKYSEENVDEAFVREKNALIAKEDYLHIFANVEQVLKDLQN